jgi:C4-dicarboxylate transporter DctM subunit
MSAVLIFGLLFALMLTGMPISISLGLTVLTFLFTMTQVPIESVGLKLFSGLDNFGIMAIPFFILAGTFLTRGGVARRMIAFTTSIVGHLPGGLGLAGVAACAMFAAISGSSVATVVAIGSIMMPAMVEHGYPRRMSRSRRRARHPGAAVDHPCAVRRFHQYLDRGAVHGRHRAGDHAGFDARGGDLVHRLAQRLPAHAKGHAQGAMDRVS